MTEKHKLISRIVDREDRPNDWATLDGVATQDPAAWRDLLFALRDDAEVRHAVGAHLAVADDIVLPAGSAGARNGWGASALLAATGWLAAVVLAVLWLGSTLLWGDSPAAGTDALADLLKPTEAGQGAEATAAMFAADEAVADQVMGELPRLMVQVRPIAGREEIEVLYVRRTLERVLVKKAYQLKVDESGHAFTVPADLTSYMPPRSY